MISYLQQEVVFFGKQVQQFAQVRGNITQILGAAKADSFISKAVFLISTGSNDIFDFANNNTDLHVGVEDYLSILQLTYFSHLKVSCNFTHKYVFGPYKFFDYFSSLLFISKCIFYNFVYWINIAESI